MARTRMDDEAWRKERMARIDIQTERIARLLGIDAEEIMYQGTAGVVLTPDQCDALLALITVTVTPDVCNCRCRQGSHCGGCGHPGCGYRP